METQNLSKPGEILQKYDYTYGQPNANNVLKNNGKLAHSHQTFTERVEHIKKLQDSKLLSFEFGICAFVHQRPMQTIVVGIFRPKLYTRR